MASYYLEILEFLYDTGLTKLGMFDVLRLFLEFDFLCEISVLITEAKGRLSEGLRLVKLFLREIPRDLSF